MIDSKAEQLYIQSRDLYSGIGDQFGLTQSVWALGEVYWKRKEYSKAEESYIQSRDLYSRIGNQLGLAQSVNALGDVKDIIELETGPFLTNMSWNLGLLHSKQAQYEEAERLVRQASPIYGELGLKERIADCDNLLATICRSREQSLPPGT
ncbi:hypothetical protein M407DRAFT_29534 [Tulasnella calospora MUT 4182]|uniref:MalT-like TPR region domain-containing protein n=1 Tax=Tulasnella calospora MUT 4182 TaxID=1051891 RepID=A0A0C3PZF5_9AGAM|nr:hypothetical protein M407DRAFT_29534 [Tulasnella calospora MUT 4182]